MPAAQAHASGEIGDIGIGPALQAFGDYGRGDPFTHALDTGHTEANREIRVDVQGTQSVRRWTQRFPTGVQPESVPKDLLDLLLMRADTGLLLRSVDISGQDAHTMTLSIGDKRL